MRASALLPSRRLAALFVPTALALAACGGGNDDPPPASSGGGGGGTTPTASLTLSGVAATGGAIAARNVEARCNGGSGSATSGADGSYSIALNAGALPCVLRVTTADDTKLHSVAAGSGASAKANLTPVSELVVARLAGGLPGTYFGAFDASAAAALTSAKVQTAAAAVVDTLKSAGVDFSTTGDVLTGTLVAANGGTAGNAHDQALDKLKTTIASSGTTLPELTATVARSAPDAPATAFSGVPSLPADMLLRPAAANCQALRSGSYRFVGFTRVAAGAAADTERFTIDAPKLILNAIDGPAPLVPNGSCRYTVSDMDIVVSPAGVMLIRFTEGDASSTVWGMGIAFPEQTHGVADLAGEWNTLGTERKADGSSYELHAFGLTIGSSGVVGAAAPCPGLANCSAIADLPPISFKVNPAGGFTWTNTRDGWTDPLYVYRTGGGELMGVTTAGNGSFSLWTRARTHTMPSVGTVSEFWTTGVTNQLFAFAYGNSKNTITALDSANMRFTRQNTTGTAGATVQETLVINSPKAGYTRRLGATGVTASDGSTVNVGEFVSLGLRGAGVTAVGVIPSQQLVLSVTKPAAP